MSITTVIGGVRHLRENDRYYFFYTNDIILCDRHTRGMRLQPFTTYDAEKGYGSFGCPFCNKTLVYSHYRSQKKLCVALDELAKGINNVTN